LGDIVLATAFLANLRALQPSAEIRFLTTPAGARLLSPNTFGVKVISYDKRGNDSGPGGFLRMARELRGFAPELVFCLHRSLRSTLLAKVSGGEVWGFSEGVGSVLFTGRVARAKGRFEAEKNQALLAAWAGERALQQALFPILSVSDKDTAEGDTLLGGLQGFVALAPGSVWATKRWPPERFAGLAQLLWERHGLRSVIVGGNEPADREAAMKLLVAYREGAEKVAPLPLDLTGKTGLGGLKSVLSRAKLVVANDSAPLHMGIAMGVSVLGVFGPTTRELGFFPLAPEGKAKVAELAGLECRPCGLHGHDQCPRTHFRCMLDLSPEAVYREAELLCR
jgi:heptosyltransferase-2